MGFFDDEDEDNGIPECHGDDDYYDDDDRTCKDCAYQRSCALKVRKLTTTTTKSSFRSSLPSKRNGGITKRSNTVSTKKPDVVIEEDDDASFTGALVHNASIEAMQAMVDELANSIRHIPRKSYKNTWKRKKE